MNEKLAESTIERFTYSMSLFQYGVDGEYWKWLNKKNKMSVFTQGYFASKNLKVFIYFVLFRAKQTICCNTNHNK